MAIETKEFYLNTPLASSEIVFADENELLPGRGSSTKLAQISNAPRTQK